MSIKFPSHQQAVMDRFISVCRDDARVVAAFLSGSYARGAADHLSDLDLSVIITDEGFEDFTARLPAFIRQFGEPVFLENFGQEGFVYYIFENGAEGELSWGSESRFGHISSGPHHVLLDKKNILAGVVFRGSPPDQAGQIENLRRLITFFWHELSHFITAVGRGQWLWAQGQLEAMRGMCISLARLQNNFNDHVTDEPYFKIEDALPAEQLAVLQPTFRPIGREDLLSSIRVIIQLYKDLAIPLAQTYGIPYPHGFEQIMLDRLDRINTP